MTVPNEIAANRYEGDGATSTFAYGFHAQDAADVAVYVQDDDGLLTQLDPATDYEVDPASDLNGGEITLLGDYEDLPEDHLVAVALRPELNSGAAFRDAPTLSRAALEDAFDRMSMRILRLQDELDRSVRLPITEAWSDELYLPSRAARAGMTLGFDENGDFTVGTEFVGLSDEPTFSGITLSGLTPSSLVATDAESTLTTDVSGMTPEFTGLALSGLSASSLVATDGESVLTTDVSGMTPEFAGLALSGLSPSTLVATDAESELTTDVAGLSPTFASLTLTVGLTTPLVMMAAANLTLGTATSGAVVLSPADAETHIRNGAASQSLHLFGKYVSGSNFSKLYMECTDGLGASVLTVATGGPSENDLNLGTTGAASLFFVVGNAAEWGVYHTTADLSPIDNGTTNLGKATQRINTVHATTVTNTGGNLTLSTATSGELIFSAVDDVYSWRAAAASVSVYHFYGEYTNSTNYSRITLTATTGSVTFITAADGSGTGGELNMGTGTGVSQAVNIFVAGNNRWRWTTTGHYIPVGTPYDIGSTSSVCGTIYGTNLGGSSNYYTAAYISTLNAATITKASADVTIQTTVSGDVVLAPAGLVKFGSFSAIAAETLAGYVTFKTSDGSTRKLAVIA